MGFHIVEIDGLPVEDLDVQSNQQGVVIAGTLDDADSETTKSVFLRTTEDGRLITSLAKDPTSNAILMTLGSILSQLQRIGDSLESLAEE